MGYRKMAYERYVCSGLSPLVNTFYNRKMNMHTSLVRRFFFPFAIMGLFCAPLFSSAQTENMPSGAFIIKPAKVELVVLPGEKKESILTLSNNTALPLHVDISFEDVAPSLQSSPSDDPVKLLGTHGGEYTLKDLFGVSRSSFDLLSGKEVRVPVTVSIPKDVEAGGKYGSVVFTFHPVTAPGDPQSANVAIESRVATLFFVRISGDAKEKGKLVAFGLFNNAKSVSSPSPENPLHFQVAYENTGNVHLNPYGRVTLVPFFGSDQVILIDPWVVLPGATRMRELVVTNALSIGYYRAHIELNRGYNDIVDDEEVSFWILPSAQNFSFFIVIALIIGLLVRRSLRISKHRAF